MTTTVAVFTRDLRVRDNPMLAAAVRGAEHVVPPFVRHGRLTAVSAYARAREKALRRYVPELATVADVRRPWTLSAKARNGYPLPIVDLAEGRARFLAARG